VVGGANDDSSSDDDEWVTTKNGRNGPSTGMRDVI